MRRGDGLPVDKEPHHRSQHQGHVQPPEHQRGPQPLRPSPRLLCVQGLGGSAAPQHPPPQWPSPHAHLNNPTLMGSTPTASSRIAQTTHTAQHPSPTTVFIPTTSSPCSTQWHPYKQSLCHALPDSLHPTTTPKASNPMAFTPPPFIYPDGLHCNVLQPAPAPEVSTPKASTPCQHLPAVPDSAMMLLPGPAVPRLPDGAGALEPRSREARGLKERQRKTKAQRAIRERSSMPWLPGEGGGFSCFTCGGKMP